MNVTGVGFDESVDGGDLTNTGNFTIAWPNKSFGIWMDSANFISAVIPGQYAAYLIPGNLVQFRWVYARKGCYGVACSAYIIAIGY